jgi:hypothetical protein
LCESGFPSPSTANRRFPQLLHNNSRQLYSMHKASAAQFHAEIFEPDAAPASKLV